MSMFIMYGILTERNDYTLQAVCEVSQAASWMEHALLRLAGEPGLL